MNLFDLLRSDGSIVVNKSLAHEIGLNEAIIYSELVSLHEYWRKQERLTDDQWFFCTVENLEKHTTLSKGQQSRVIKKLEELKLIETRRRGLPAKRYFKITDEIYNLVLSKAHSNQKSHNAPTSGEIMRDTESTKQAGNNTRTNNTKSLNKNIYTHAHEEELLKPEELEKRRELARYNWLSDIESKHYGQ